MKKILVASVVIVIIAAIAVFVTSYETDNPKYDNFAKCLTEKGVKMYGTYWCPHCQNQKRMFDGSWQYVNYIECSLPDKAGQTEICKIAGIKGYPTWEFSDGKRLEGEVIFAELSQLSGCELPA